MTYFEFSFLIYEKEGENKLGRKVEKILALNICLACHFPAKTLK